MSLKQLRAKRIAELCVIAQRLGIPHIRQSKPELVSAIWGKLKRTTINFAKPRKTFEVFMHPLYKGGHNR
jgi:hypothetical protein